jgi:nucleotide-binding universal stress UspA family protein
VRILVWVADGSWPAAVDAARGFVPADAEVTLLHVTDPGAAEAVHGPWAGLLGRGRGHDPSAELAALATEAESELLAAAEQRFGRPVRGVARDGRMERVVTAEAAGADLLVVVRDGDPDRVGPRSLGRAGRFIVDHAPCPVLLVWAAPPRHADLPPSPPPGEKPPPPGEKPPPPGEKPRHERR